MDLQAITQILSLQGKSSIVCAIALGLGYRPSVLARGKNIRHFVRKGMTKGYVQIELQGRSQGETVTIKHTITADKSVGSRDTYSSFQVNGEDKRMDEVQALVSSFNINLDNLCNFLPQELVSAFAQKTATERLIETMRTTGGDIMVQQFEDLSDKSVREKKLAASCNEERVDLENQIRRNAELEVDVKRFKEHQTIIDRIQLLERKRPVVDYECQKQKYDEQKVEASRLKDVMEAVKSENEPLRNAIRKAQDGLDTSNNMLKQAQAEMTNLKNDQKQVLRSTSEAQKAIDAASNKFGQIDVEIKRNREKLAEAKTNLAKFEAQKKSFNGKLLAELKDQKVADLKDIKAGKDREIREVTEAKKQHDKKLEDTMATEREAEAKLDRLRAKVKEQTDVKMKKVAELKQAVPNLDKAIQWIDKNRKSFKYQVFGPIVGELNVADERYLAQVESVVGMDILKTFVCQCQQDYNKILSYCSDQMNWGVNVVNFDNKRLSDYKTENSTSLGFEYVILDLIKAPEPVLVALCELKAIHRVPVTLEEKVDTGKLRSLQFYIAGNTQYRQTVSKYGAKAVSMLTATLPPARFMINGQTDEDAVRQLSKDIAELDKKLQMHLKPAVADARKIVNGYENKLDQLEVDKKKFADRRKTIADIERKIGEVEVEIRRHRDMVKDASNQPDHEDWRQQCLTDLQQAFVNKVEAFVELDKVLAEVVDCCESQTDLKLAAMQCDLDLRRLEDEMQATDHRLVEAQQMFSQLKEQLKVTRRLMNDKLEVQADLPPVQANQMALFDSLPDNLEDLDMMLAEFHAKAELNDDTDPILVQQYVARQRHIEQLQQVYDNHTEELRELQATSDAIRNDWEPKVLHQLSVISQRFSEYFAKMQCSGEVQLNRHEDQDKWGIDILVRFRDGQDLAPLDSHRQSGGERSVSIMMFLMSLQSFSTSPFRVVDEINQGMDPRNERMVHTQLVETVCGGERQGQYFLITPKLLPDLDYHRDMRIHVVCNGVNLPADRQWKDSELV